MVGHQVRCGAPTDCSAPVVNYGAVSEVDLRDCLETPVDCRRGGLSAVARDDTDVAIDILVEVAGFYDSDA